MIGTQRGTRMMARQRSSARRSGGGRRRWLPPAMVLFLLLSAGAGGLAPTGVAQAARGTDSTCTQASIQGDLTAGGTWTLDCASSTTTIPFTAPVTFSSGTAAVQVASGKSVILDGGHSTRLFTITGGTLSLSGFTLQNGRATGTVWPDSEGGAIFNIGGAVSVSNDSFSGNSSRAILNASVNGIATLSVSNSTFSANTGGAIDNSGTMSVTNSTFSGNSAPAGGAIYISFGSLSVSSTIIANNTCATLNGATLTDVGYNLEYQGGGALTCGFTNHAVNNQDPRLGSVQNNGGPTPTMALLPGSPAIDVIPRASCVDASGAPLTTDQRGFVRPDDSEAVCDIGAYESGASTPAPLPFRDGFESGDFAAWSSIQTGPGGVAVVQSSIVKSGQFAARLSATSQPGSYAYARKAFTPAQTHLSASGDVRILAEGASGSTVPLFRFFDPSGTLIASLYRANHTNGQLWVQASGAYRRTGGSLPLNAWAHLELYVATVGANQSTVEVRLNGALIYQNRGLSLGTAGVSTVQIGNEAHQQVFDLVADNIVVQ